MSAIINHNLIHFWNKLLSLLLLSQVKLTGNDATSTLHVTLVVILWVHNAISSLAFNHIMHSRSIHTGLLVDTALTSPWNSSKFIH
jgi:hypothetical protein